MQKWGTRSCGPRQLRSKVIWHVLRTPSGVLQWWQVFTFVRVGQWNTVILCTQECYTDIS